MVLGHLRPASRSALEKHAKDSEKYTRHGREVLRETWVLPISDNKASTHSFSKSQDMRDTKGLSTVDRYNNLTWREFPERGKNHFGPFGEHGKDLPDDTLRARLNAFRMQESDEQNLSLPQRSWVKKFQDDLLEHPSYSPFRTRRDVTQPQKAKELMEKEGLGPPANASALQLEIALQKTQFRSQTIRACKFGIEFGQLQGRSVQFELGGMETANIGKGKVGRFSSSSNGSPGVQLRSITNAELRKAFRSDRSDESLRFYRDGKAVSAPWGQQGAESQAWKDYSEHRLQKYQKLGFVPDRTAWAKASATDVRAGFRSLNQQINSFKLRLKSSYPQSAAL